MFPNVRLMIAATFASVVALICGFGVFAAIHVSHEPLVRLRPATAPLQLLADNTAILPVIAGQPFNHGSQITEPAGMDGGEGGNSALAYSATQPTEQPMTQAIVPTADDHERDASEPEPTPTPPSPPPPADSVDAPTPQQAAAPEAAPEAKPDEAAEATEPTGEQAAASAANVSAIAPPTAEPPTEQAHPAEQTIQTQDASAVSTAAEPVQIPPETAVATVKKTAKGTRVAARIHRALRASGGASAQSSTQTFNWNSSFAATAVQTEPQWWRRQAQEQAARGQRSRITARTSSDPSGATGGPFVSAPNP